LIIFDGISIKLSPIIYRLLIKFIIRSNNIFKKNKGEIMIQETFIDGVQEIGFGKGIIRMNLASLSATEHDDKNNPTLEVRHRLLMTPEGFLNLFGAMENIAKQLADAKIFKFNKNRDAKIGAEQDSPNFR
jgi:hypothetical protein